jgi:hypothetical protein
MVEKKKEDSNSRQDIKHHIRYKGNHVILKKIIKCLNPLKHHHPNYHPLIHHGHENDICMYG